MRIFTWQLIGAVSLAAIALILLYWLVVRTSDSPVLSANEANSIAARHVAFSIGHGGGCNFAVFDASRAVWVVSCNHPDPAKCEEQDHTITCGPDATVRLTVLVDDQSAEVYEPN